MKKIQRSQHKLLNDLYGETWKTIPSLLKTKSHKYDNFNGISKKLFNDDESDKENIRSDLKKHKELILTKSEVKRNNKLYFDDIKSKKKLYTEKIPSTPDVPKVRKANTTVKKKGITVTELVGMMNKDVDILTNKIKSINVTPVNNIVNRLSFIGSLAGN